MFLANLNALLSAGLDLNVTGAIHFVRMGDLRMLDLLLAHGADINTPCPDGEDCLLKVALYYTHDDAVVEKWLRALRERGLDLRNLPSVPKAQEERKLRIVSKLLGGDGGQAK
jgi:hypothetical protein